MRREASKKAWGDVETTLAWISQASPPQGGDPLPPEVTSFLGKALTRFLNPGWCILASMFLAVTAVVAYVLVAIVFMDNRLWCVISHLKASYHFLALIVFLVA